MTEFRCLYRLQLRPYLDFRRAAELVPYLGRLGVSHLYLSPVMQACPGSAHGYDVVDPTLPATDLGGEEALRALCEGPLGVILDVVPNHMAVSEEHNRFWQDELARAKFFDVAPRTGRARRFFDIDDLAGVRVEDPDVFEATHSKVIELVRDGLVDGIRVDHPDGLASPARYFERLREAGIDHVWAEKILQSGEQLRDWPIEGTTGYQFANDVTALFIDPDAEETLTSLYQELTGERCSFDEIALESKLELARTTFDPEVEELYARLDQPDGEELDLARALASFPVYRTYVDPDTGEVDDLDRQAVAGAGLPQQLAAILLLEERGHDAFVTRFQQTTPAVTGKGVEDTAFYRYNRLLCLNEVGGNPARFSLQVEDFHTHNLERARRFPHELLTTHTHDMKRSGDVRARIGALSTLAPEWRRLVQEWRAVNKPLRRGAAPDANTEYLIYQTLAGTWPVERERLLCYVEKASREAKLYTSWNEEKPDWERQTADFCRRLYGHRPFLDSFEPFVDRLARRGERVALAQTLLKLTCPGTPDLYQGDELWNLSLVDPDNRRPVDWPLRDRLLAELEQGSPARRDTAKLELIWKTLQLRARRPDAFDDERYEPIDAGPGICAYRRGADIVVAVGTRPGATYDPPRGFRDILDTQRLGVWLLERS